MAGLQGSGKTTATAKLAKMLREQNNSSVAVAACARLPAGGRRAARQGRRTGRRHGLRAGHRPRPGRHRRLGARPGHARRQGRADRRHLRPPARRPGADGGAGADQEARPAPRCPARGRRHDRPGRRQRRRAVRRGRAVRRRRAVQARRRRPRGRRAVGQGGHRQADHVRLHGEKLGDFERFHLDRMAQRILGMGDVLSFIEKAEQSVEEDEAKGASSASCARTSSRSRTSSTSSSGSARWAR